MVCLGELLYEAVHDIGLASCTAAAQTLRLDTLGARPSRSLDVSTHPWTLHINVPGELEE